MASRAAANLLKPLIVALHLIVLHRADGGEVIVNPTQITSLRSPAGQVARGHCIVGLTDGKFVVVLEACALVKRQLESPD